MSRPIKVDCSRRKGKGVRNYQKKKEHLFLGKFLEGGASGGVQLVQEDGGGEQARTD